MSSSPRLDALTEALRCLPGVGARTAQRMAHQLLERNREAGRRLAQRLLEAMDGVGNCQRCRNFSDTDLCTICSNASRDGSQLCVIEMPADQVAIEQATSFRGLYFVLLGRLFY